MFKRLSILALMSVLLASAKTTTKTYVFGISENAVAGNAQLTPGVYHLKLDGSQVVLTDQAGKQVDTTATVETADHKFAETSIVFSTEDGTNRIVSIRLGGSSYRVVFQ